MYKILNDFEGANIRILAVEKDRIKLDTELRDTVGDWFFWCFKVVGAGGKKLTFEFPNNIRVGYYGAAVSYDLINWKWQFQEPTHNGASFTYTFAEDEEVVYFAHDMVYRPQRFFEFAEKNALQVNTLCMSERGRAVPYVETGKGEEIILLTARHHACESTGSYVLEGVLPEMIKRFADRFKIICIPMVDYDGVCDGDQGKNRRNHDHNRDYVEGESPWYAAVAKIRELLDSRRVRFAFDFHSPWHLGGSNDTVFIPSKHYSMIKRIARFSNLLEELTKEGDALPHYAYDDIQPDVDWNRFGSPCFGTYAGRTGAELAFTLETTYFTASGVAFSPERAKKTGVYFAQALEQYLEQGYRIGITGDILYQNPMNIWCKTPSGYDYRAPLLDAFSAIMNCHFLVTNPETPFAGEKLGYTCERYSFNTPEAALEMMKVNGFDLLTLANNHCTDRGIAGLYATCDNCEKTGLPYVGISKGDRKGVHIEQTPMGKVAFVNATYGTNAFANHVWIEDERLLKSVALTMPQETKPGAVDLLKEPKSIQEATSRLYSPDSPYVKPFLEEIAGDISYAKANAEYVIMLLHSGGQYNTQPDAYTLTLCRRIREMGADMIVTNHPHLILPCTYEDGYLTAYCLGNLQSAVRREQLSVINEIDPTYSAVLFLEFKNMQKEPKLSFSIMKSVFDPEDRTHPRVYNTYELWNRSRDCGQKSEILFYANRFSGGNHYDEVMREYPLNP